VTPERWKQVKGVVGAALDRPAEERGALVDAACAGDAELRTEVESLLASASEAHEFLETAGRPALLRPPPEGRPETRAGARVGPYRILGEIGSRYERAVAISALNGTGLDELLGALETVAEQDMVRLKMLVPYGREQVLYELRQLGGLEGSEFTERGTVAWGRAPRASLHRFQPFLLEPA